MQKFNIDSSDITPESLLINELSPHWKKRFEKAIHLMREHLSAPFNWQEIADQCAVSASHFHVMFRTIFGETPATYHRRMRLKQVLFELYFYPEKSINNIALDAGFSTSQALAKVLQREFGQSAKQIRQQDINDNYEELRQKIEHTAESKLNHNLKFSIITLDEQHLKLDTIDLYSFKEARKYWRKIAPKSAEVAVYLSPWQVIQDIRLPYKMGFYCAPAQANVTLEPQCFLSCKVKFKDASSYIKCWEYLYFEAMQQGYEINEEFGLLEYIHNPHQWIAFSHEVTMLLPITIDSEHITS